MEIVFCMHIDVTITSHIGGEIKLPVEYVAGLGNFIGGMLYDETFLGEGFRLI